MKHEIAHMLENGGGVIVNTSSVAGSKGIAGIGLCYIQTWRQRVDQGACA